MKIELDITTAQAQQLISATENLAGFETIRTQLQNAVANADDSQKGEVPEEGDNEVVKRDE